MAFFVLSVATVAWQCFVVALDTQLGGMRRMLHEWHVVAISIANALLLLSPYWLLKRRWRWLVWIPLTLMALWCLMQLCYCRAYDDLMPWRSLLMTDNVNSTLAASTVSLLRWLDLLIVLPFLALIAVCLLSKRVNGDAGRYRMCLYTLLAVAGTGAFGFLDGAES